MTKEAALNNFWNGFGIPAYPNTAVPEDAVLPYITYEVQTSSYLGLPVNAAVNLWYYTSSEKTPNAKADEIGKAIGEGQLLKCDDGIIWVLKGDPWCTNQTGEEDNNIKLRFLNVKYKYFTL